MGCREPELGFCSPLTTLPLCVASPPRLLEACEFAGAPRPRGGPYLSCESAEDCERRRALEVNGVWASRAAFCPTYG